MLRARTLALWLTVAATTLGGFSLTAAHASPRSGVDHPIGAKYVRAAGGAVVPPCLTVQMLRATNASRRRHGERGLVLDWRLSLVARRHARAMARAHRLFHTSSIGVYLNGVGRWSAWGENIGWTTGSVGLLESAFMASPVHREHILSRTFHHVAVGTVIVRHQLWVSIFFYG